MDATYMDAVVWSAVTIGFILGMGVFVYFMVKKKMQ